MSPIQVSLIAEGLLDERVLRQLLAQVAPHLQAGVCYGKRGRSWMDMNLFKYNLAARIWPYVALADLEQAECPPVLLDQWFPDGKHTNLQARIAVHMVEAWLLADQEALAEYLGIAAHHIPQFPDQEANPKLVMVNLARRSRYRIIREDLAPAPASSAVIGRNYSGQLEKFVTEKWQSERAEARSPSLQRAIRSLQQFHSNVPVKTNRHLPPLSHLSNTPR